MTRAPQSVGGITGGDDVRSLLNGPLEEEESDEEVVPMTNNGNRHGDEPQANNNHYLQKEEMRRLFKTQEETALALSNLNLAQVETVRTLSDLNSAIRELRSAVENNNRNSTNMSQQHKQAFTRGTSDTLNNNWTVDKPLLSQPRRRSVISDLGDSERSQDLDDSSREGDELALDRKQVRLDGLEVYAVVSAVTAGTLVAVFESYHPGDIGDLFMEARYLELIMSIVFLATGTIGIVCGLHCIFVFSLITMYGRTALGMERDDALEVFFADTGMQRIHGFRTFVGSLYSLMIQLSIVITSKVSSNPWFLVAALVMTGRLMHYVYADTQIIMEKAMVIFSSPSPVNHRKALVSAISAVKLMKEVDTSEDEEDSSGLSLENKSTKDSGSESRSKAAAKRKTTIRNNNRKSSAMAMAATAFDGASSAKSSQDESKSRLTSLMEARGNSIRWSFGDVGDEGKADNDGVSSRSLSDSAGALNKAAPRRKRSSLPIPASTGLMESIEGDEGNNDTEESSYISDYET
jgi:hypothetical protein